MTQQLAVPSFAVISGAEVDRALADREGEVMKVIESAYRLHSTGVTVNPPSYFLKFPDQPTARIIALPASLGSNAGVAGLKWISSFPENVNAGMPRASAVLILNDLATGYPFACLESSIISAARTAASAALAADHLTRHRPRPTRLGLVGTGLIARFIHRYLAATGWTFDEIRVHDTSADHARGFLGYLDASAGERGGTFLREDDAEQLIRGSDLVVFATVAGAPHVTNPQWFDHNPVVLNVSLRDLAPEVILGSTNVVDDVDHCLTSATSVHLAEQLSGGRDFLDGTLAEVMDGRVTLPADRPIIFSPFGLGVLDVALGQYVYDAVCADGLLTVVEDFFHEMRRYG